MLPDFNRLKVFYFVYHHGSTAMAAKKLHVTQPAVSQHLKKLEAEIGARLFTRMHKGLAPTSAGETLYGIVKPFMDNIERNIEQIQMAHEGPRGRLRIGAPVEFGEKVLPGICARFRKQHPHVSFHLEMGHPRILLPLVKEGRLDLAFADIFSQKGIHSRELSLFEIQPVTDEKLVMVCSRSYHDQYIRGDYSLENLKERDFVAYQEHAPAIRSWFRHHFDKIAIHPHIIISVESVRSVITFVRHHMGLGIVPYHFIDHLLVKGELILIPGSKTEIINRISLVQLQDKVPTILEKRFLEHFHAQLKELT
jgi:DNA-binding transcriptional LysR family regulator